MTLHAAEIQPRLLTEKAAAKYLSISVETLRAHVPITKARIGSAVRYDVHDLDAYVDALTGKGKARPRSPDDWLGKLDADGN